MRRTSRLLVLFGIGLAVLTFVLIVSLLGPGGSGPGPGQPTPSPAVNVTVVKAAQDIPLGTVVTGEMLTTATVPVSSAASDSFRDPSLVLGQVARRAIVSGAQVREADFDVNQATDVIQVPPGKRAVAVSIGELTGVGKLIHVGDTVDLVVTFDENAIKILTIQPGSQTAQHDDGFRPVTVKAPLLLQDIQVIGAIDSPTAAAGAATGGTGGTGAEASPGPAATAGPTLTGTTKLIILAVTDAQAEAIVFARTAGTVDLILRSPADAGTTATTSGVVLRTMFETYGVLPPYVQRQFPIFVPQQQP